MKLEDVIVGMRIKVTDGGGASGSLGKFGVVKKIVINDLCRVELENHNPPSVCILCKRFEPIPTFAVGEYGQIEKMSGINIKTHKLFTSK